MKDFRDKVVVVTGGAGGIGRALGARFARAGARIVLADVDGPALDAAVTALANDGARVVGEVVDVADDTQVETLARRCFEHRGGAHVLVNNAAVLPAERRALWEVSANTWTWALGTNLVGVTNGLRAFVPRMLEQGQPGHIVNVTSHAGGLLTLDSASTYCVTKCALGSLTEMLHLQLRAIGAPIRVTLWFPGPHTVPTRIYQPERVRPATLPPDPGEPSSPFRSLDDMQAWMQKTYGRTRPFVTPEETVEDLFQGLLEDRYWVSPWTPQFERALRESQRRVLQREDPVAPGPEIL
jgi:NAD(P)-dependent dehydrogenase (short-subunit alcohol dehydrogenase family)